MRQAEEFSREAIANGVPPFIREIHESTVANASPYVISYADFAAAFSGSERRRRLLQELGVAIDSVRATGAKPIALLVGGSFLIRDLTIPRDLDCVCFYVDSDAPPAGSLTRACERFRAEGVDMRLVPYDADPLMALKACGFFSVLYGRTRASAALQRGCLLIGFPAREGDPA